MNKRYKEIILGLFIFLGFVFLILQIRINKEEIVNDKRFSYTVDILGRIQGKAVEYYDNGGVSATGSYTNSILNGEFIEFYQDGSVFRKSYYLDGSLNGEVVVLRENGDTLKYETASGKLFVFDEQSRVIEEGRSIGGKFYGSQKKIEDNRVIMEKHFFSNYLLFETKVGDEFSEFSDFHHSYLLLFPGSSSISYDVKRSQVEIGLNVKNELSIDISIEVFKGDSYNSILQTNEEEYSEIEKLEKMENVFFTSGKLKPNKYHLIGYFEDSTYFLKLESDQNSSYVEKLIVEIINSFTLFKEKRVEYNSVLQLG